ncbi:E3 ubiquitin-protein ligase TRIM62 [Cyprinodon tularosa]|uniref:E3 ubiquitin-protein ligase TRIM62 n=1 Tax=Cyprinodon tularosa TaxID=77115 RepID=UPI0018E23C7D|nr:E3 ubiquitin-protein ligase TRIM62 [Cyprinodon tularosa]
MADGPERSLPSAGLCSFLQDGEGFSPLDSSSGAAVQPFPRSPKLQRKAARGPQLSQELLSQRLEELEAEKTKTDAHIQSLKKRKADLSRSTEVMKHQVQEHFENMHRVLKQDQQAVLDSLDLDLKQTRTRLDQILKDWLKHQEQVVRSSGSILAALKQTPSEGQEEVVSPKRPDASEERIKLDIQRFEKLQRSLSFISKQLKIQLQRKTLLLDSWPTVIDRQTSHSQILVTPEGRGAAFSAAPRGVPEHPLRFDKVCCALGSAPITAGLSYWEVDVRCCSGWAVGVAYSSLQRKGADKGAPLGRNRNSWCMELKNRNLSAWHNDRHMACQGSGRSLPRRVGVKVNYDKGQLTFYDADKMAVLHSFSAALTPVFDRAHHQFTEPLHPAVRFLNPAQNQSWPNHLELCYSL